MGKFFEWLFGPVYIGQDATDDELPYEARVTWENLEDAYDGDE